jgi:hypothetical protein
LAKQILALHRQLSSLKDVAGTFRDIANSNLAVKFGLLATISDLREFVQILLKWRETSREKHPITSYYRGKIKPIVITKKTRITEYLNFQALGPTFPVKCVYDVSNLELGQTTKFYFVAPELCSLFDRVCSLVDRLGLIDPAAAWDLIPWSFVIDWFFDISSFLRRNFKKRLWPVDVVMSDSCETLKRTINGQVFVQYTGTGLNRTDWRSQKSFHEWELIADLLIEQKARSSRIPSHLRLTKAPIKPATHLSFGRILTGACLVAQKSIVRSRWKTAGSSHRAGGPVITLLPNGDTIRTGR